MTTLSSLVTFLLDGQRHALPLAAVERVFHAVAVTPLAGAPHTVMGVIDVAGDVVPVFDLRQRFQMPSRALCPDDQFVLVRLGARRTALVVDAVDAVIEADVSQQVAVDRLLPGLPPGGAVTRLPDGLVLIHDLERFLSLEDEAALADVLEDR